MTTIAIIGGGPAGYVAAITAARQGQKVNLIEEGPLGGVCLNEGCMPTKALLESAAVLEKVQQAAEFGIRRSSPYVEIDWAYVQLRKEKIIRTLASGVKHLIKKNQIELVNGKARFNDPHSLWVTTAEGERIIRADKFIIAAGSEPVSLPFAPFAGEWVIHSGQALALSVIPATMLIIGGGVIGCEFASIYSRMGTKVSIIEMADQLLPGEDPDIAAVLHEKLKADGVSIYTSASAKKVEAEKKKVIAETAQGIRQFSPDCLLVAIGRKPRVAGLQLENSGVAYSKAGIEVNSQMQTSQPHIYACGDIVGGSQLAHVAFHEGTIAALNACGEAVHADYRAVPRCIYTSPEIAGVGLTEKQARAQYGDIKVGECAFSANGKSLILNEAAGKVKVLIEPQYNEIIGLSIVGPHATELIGQGTVMIHGEMTADSLERLIAAHPSVSEAIYEAVASTAGQAVHI
ncbi:dihydrolipoyl dehydrogenase [Pseudobacillus badius]|uniref:dihydrolipoyl dehydrogenase n=1 Tax=Bacillus badius TaxID=1455 RepID=UPI0007B0419D|nr:dihydrolipoyl dehydrogenase [Bacillus badius]KZO00095.1 dihydrolipoyl dehydrogenase [Bacillus badius]OCS86257.1 dihydrolipoyl dehydrogenase [Bacillus badius]OVE52283.1 dihydrolipoyl dehydrogenase [Bacillus badius]TDW04003.1 dihydrolipoamide dehydrogenase [Bacillus badius]